MSKEELLEKILENYNENEVVNLLAELIQIPSHKYSQYQESKVAEYIKNYFIDENIEDVKIKYIEENRPNLIAKITGKGKKNSLMLNGHLDTVPPYNMIIPAFDPVITEDKISGRGAVDMKGSIAAMLTAMALIKRSDINLKGDLYFTGVIDQEQRSIGSVDLVNQHINVDYAVVG